VASSGDAQCGELGDLPFNQEWISLQELFQGCLIRGCKGRYYTALELTRLRGHLVAADMVMPQGFLQGASKRRSDLARAECRWRRVVEGLQVVEHHELGLVSGW